ncbi:MAG: CHAT domain-containing protein [Candidatus Thiodiazotropha sp. (ex Dulcina madagascariensis)]|nr:CHAT domain-containing protein [Candidatus Thiodiazotropha sp. (ex Dulcina madagascariensis)]
MPKTIKLLLRTETTGPRGLARGQAEAADEQRQINEASVGLFSIDAITTHTIGAARARGEEVSAEYASDKIVRVELADGGQLWLTLERLQELAGQSGDRLSIATDTSLGRGGELSRGMTEWIRRISLVDIAWGDELRDAAAVTVVKRAITKIESGLIEGRTGVYHCLFNTGEPEFHPLPSGIAASDRPILVLLHGTASSTVGSFGALWGGAHRKLWLESVRGLYDERVYALEHCTLSESPIRNACVLLEQLPDNQPIHLLSHSRGGLVGELLCRGGIIDRAAPITHEDVERYLSAYPGGDSDTLEARRDIKEELEKLNRLLVEKRPRVERFVRVACPARGTTLAAKRFDVYLNLLLSGLQMAGTEFLGPLAGKFIGAMKGLAITVAHKRFDDTLLPGIKAMMPDGGLARFINDPCIKVDAALTVVGGSAKIGAGLKQTLLVGLTNLYYWQANDWVVETDAMIGGHPRRIAGCCFLDDGRQQGEAVSHFSYFRNQRTFNAVIHALAGNNGRLPGFASLEGERIKSKARGETAQRAKHITVMLPGLPGSHLSEDGDRIWLNFPRIAIGDIDRLNIRNKTSEVASDGWFRSHYEALAEYLESSGHRVEIFDYDWRISLPENSRRLGERLQALARVAEKESVAIRLLAHSMGGMVSLHWLANENPELWDRLSREFDARLVIAGTPLKGTYDTVQLLTARHLILTMIAAVDFEHNSFDLIDQFRHYPGLLETLPDESLAESGWNYFDGRDWDRLKPMLDRRWKRPHTSALQKAFGIRSQMDVDLPPLHGNRVLYLAGQDNATIDGLTTDNGELAFRFTAEGDGLTTWASIPDWLKGDQCWYLPRVKHGDLLREDDAFPAIQELLETGATQLLSQHPPAIARGLPVVPDVGPDTPLLYPTADDIEAAALHGSFMGVRLPQPALPKCHVRIRHGNLQYANVPVMVGHYEDDGIEGSEAALDAMLDGRLKALYRANLYPGALQTVEIVTRPGAEQTVGAVVAGLGPVGHLTASTLQQTLQHALVRFGLDQGEKSYRSDASGRHRALALASLVVGSGVGGLPLADALKALLEAVAGANQQLRALHAPHLQRLDIIELFEDQVIAIAHACARVNPEMDAKLTFDLSIDSLQGELVRPFFAEQSPWWRRIQITDSGKGRLEFAPITDKAAIDIQAHTTQTSLIDAMLAMAATTTANNISVNQSLFELLIPDSLKAQVEAQGGMVLLVDDSAAKYPWELLTNRRSRDARPLATRLGLIRQLYSRSGEAPRVTVRNNMALVVGDSEAGSEFPDLPGAVAEAQIVSERLNRMGYDASQPLIKRKGVEIVIALTNEDYQIVHLAGHGIFDHPLIDPRTGREEKKTGMVLGDGIVLGTEEIKALGRMPELVFINCCHLGANRELPVGGLRHELAANLGTAFIRSGAKCVVAAGWAVDDAAAVLFAEIFYEKMLAGISFGKAVTRAREAVFDKYSGTNTWGAYQCYGDYAYTLKQVEEVRSAETKTYFSAREFEIEASNIRSLAYTAELESSEAVLLERLERLQEQLQKKPHFINGPVCAAVGAACLELNEFAKSAEWCRQAQDCQDGGVTFKTLENRANALARQAEQLATKIVAGETPDTCLKRMHDAASLAEEAIAQTQSLIRFGDTLERSNILASAYKHHGFINAVVADKETTQGRRRKAQRRARDSLFAAYQRYRKQSEKAWTDSAGFDSYSLLNSVTLWLYLTRLNRLPEKIKHSLQTAASIRQALERLGHQLDSWGTADGKQYFWDRTDRINLDLYKALINDRLHHPARPPVWKQLAGRYQEAFRLASQRERDSVIKQIRILTILLGRKGANLEALAKLYETISGEDLGQLTY